MTSEMLYNYVTCFKNAFSISGDLRLSGVQISLISDTGPMLAIREPCPLDPVTGFRELGGRATCFQGAWENWKTFEESWRLREHFGF